MKAIIIGATNDIEYGAKLLKEFGIESIAIDGNENAPGFSYTDNKKVIDISDKERVVTFLSKEKFDFILPVPIGRYLSTIGSMNEHFNLKGLGEQAAIYCTDKWLFHNALNAVGLREAVAHLVNKNFDETKLENFGYPAIIKPRFGSGSRGVSQVENATEAMKIVKEIIKDEEDYIIETAIPGTEFGVDGIVINGESKVVLVREKKLTPAPNRQALGYYSTFSNKEFPNLFEKVVKYIKRIIDVMQIDNSLFHADIMVYKNNLFVIELSGRPSGHNLHNNFTIKATGYDMLKEYIKFQIGSAYSLEIPKANHLLIQYFDFENVIIKQLPDSEEIRENEHVLQYVCNIREGDFLGEISQGSEVITRGYVILIANTRKDLDKQYQKIKEKFVIERRKN